MYNVYLNCHIVVIPTSDSIVIFYLYSTIHHIHYGALLIYALDSHRLLLVGPTMHKKASLGTKV